MEVKQLKISNFGGTISMEQLQVAVTNTFGIEYAWRSMHKDAEIDMNSIQRKEPLELFILG